MIKHIILGVWICIVSLGSAYGVMHWQVEQAKQEKDKPKENKDIDQIRTKLINVPLVHNGNVVGYVIAQFMFTVEAKMLKESSVKPDLFVVDEAFRVIYSGEVVDFRKLDKSNVAELGVKIKENVNKRLGADLIREVFVQELNYLPKEQFRGGTVGGK